MSKTARLSRPSIDGSFPKCIKPLLPGIIGGGFGHQRPFKPSVAQRQLLGGKRTSTDAADLPLNRCPQSRNRIVPLIRYSCKVITGLFNRAGPDRKTALPANTPAVDDAGVLQHPQVLGNCLACMIETVGQFGNRIIPTIAEARYQFKARDTAKGGKHRCRLLTTSANP